MIDFIRNNAGNIISLIGIIFTAYTGWRLGKLKDTSDRKAAAISAEEALRDDLIELYEKAQNTIEKKDKSYNDLKQDYDKLQLDHTESLITIITKNKYIQELESEKILLKTQMELLKKEKEKEKE